MRHACRCSRVARKRRGNHASGTPKVRPSERSTHMLSSSNRTLTALTKEFIPRFFDALTVRLDQHQQLAQGSRAEPLVVGKMYLGLEPKFRLAVSLLDMDVRWLPR